MLSHSAAGLRSDVYALLTNGQRTRYGLIHNGSYFMFRFYKQRLDGIQPRSGPAVEAALHGTAFTVTLYGSGFRGMRDGGDAARCRFGARQLVTYGYIRLHTSQLLRLHTSRCRFGARQLPVLSIRDDAVAICQMPQVTPVKTVTPVTPVAP